MTTSYNLQFNSPGEAYVVQTRNCVETHRRVFKFGRTRCMAKRLSQYPKGTRLVACLPVSHMIDAERMLMALCRKRFIQRKDFGSEYFEGDAVDIVGALVNVVSHFPHTGYEDIHGHGDKGIADRENDRKAIVHEAGHHAAERGERRTEAPASNQVIVLPGSKTVSLQGLAMNADSRLSLSLLQEGRAMDLASSFVLWAKANAILPRRGRRRGDNCGEWVDGPEEQKWSRWLESYRAAAKNVSNVRNRRRPFAYVVIPYLDLHLGRAYWMGVVEGATDL